MDKHTFILAILTSILVFEVYILLQENKSLLVETQKDNPLYLSPFKLYLLILGVVVIGGMLGSSLVIILPTTILLCEIFLLLASFLKHKKTSLPLVFGTELPATRFFVYAKLGFVLLMTYLFIYILKANFIEVLTKIFD